MSIQQEQPHFATRTPVDFVVVGSGAAGGVMAKELSTAGFDVVVLEQGPYMRSHQFTHDEIGGRTGRGLGASFDGDPQSFRKNADEDTETRPVPPHSHTFPNLINCCTPQ